MWQKGQKTNGCKYYRVFYWVLISLVSGQTRFLLLSLRLFVCFCHDNTRVMCRVCIQILKPRLCWFIRAKVLPRPGGLRSPDARLGNVNCKIIVRVLKHCEDKARECHHHYPPVKREEGKTKTLLWTLLPLMIISGGLTSSLFRSTGWHSWMTSLVLICAQAALSFSFKSPAGQG